jgi:hypothetical protein
MTIIIGLALGSILASSILVSFYEGRTIKDM